MRLLRTHNGPMAASGKAPLERERAQKRGGVGDTVDGEQVGCKCGDAVASGAFVWGEPRRLGHMQVPPRARRAVSPPPPPPPAPSPRVSEPVVRSVDGPGPRLSSDAALK